MITRRVAPNDLEIIVQLIQYFIATGESASVENIQRLTSGDNSYLVVGLVNDNLVGYTLAYRFPSLYHTKHIAYLYDVEVIPEFRNQGYGKILIQSILALLKKENVDEVWLGTAIENEPAKRLFESTGGHSSGETFTEYFYNLADTEKID